MEGGEAGGSWLVGSPGENFRRAASHPRKNAECYGSRVECGEMGGVGMSKLKCASYIGQ